MDTHKTRKPLFETRNVFESFALGKSPIVPNNSKGDLLNSQNVFCEQFFSKGFLKLEGILFHRKNCFEKVTVPKKAVGFLHNDWGNSHKNSEKGPLDLGKRFCSTENLNLFGIFEMSSITRIVPKNPKYFSVLAKRFNCSEK